MIRETVNLRIRGASVKDFKFIEALYKSYEFKIDYKHLERIMLVEDDIGIVAVGSLNTILEVAFLTDQTRSQKSRVVALTALMDQVDREVKELNYDCVHSFATNDSILKILKGKFKFIKTTAKQVLIRWIKE